VGIGKKRKGLPFSQKVGYYLRWEIGKGALRGEITNLLGQKSKVVNGYPES